MTWSYVTGGTLAPDAPSYVERQADQDLFESLKACETCYVLNSRQMGKSSLCVRTILRLKEAGIRSAFCDLTKFGGRNLTAEQWYAALLSEIGRELGMRGEFLNHWKANVELPPVQRLFGAIAELAPLKGPVVIFFDEIDVTLSLPFSADEFFAAIRQCYVGRATDESLKNLSFCLLGTATPADLIKDTRVSPFNIGKRIELQDFTESEARPLAAGLGSEELLSQVLYWTAGHPYLTQRLCQAVQNAKSKTRQEVDQVCSDLFLTHKAKESDDNLAFVRNRLLRSEADLAALLDLYRQMRAGKPVQDDETNPLCAVLKLSGVAKVESGQLKVRNRIYEHVFDHNWVESHMPDAEKRRQREAYRRGVLRTLAYSLAALILVGGLAVFGFESAKRAKAAEAKALATSEENKRNLYFSEMNNLQLYDQEGNLAQMAQVLEETKNSPYRGFEWGYWNGVLHDADEEYAIDSPRRDQIPSAQFSIDGHQILIRDTTLETAFVIDRASKKVVGRYHVSNDQEVFPTKSGWRTFDQNLKATIRSLETGKIVYTLDLSGSTPYRSVNAFAEAGLLSTFEPQVGNVEVQHARLWDATSGKCVWTYNSQNTVMFPLAVSLDGERVLALKYKVAKMAGTGIVGAVVLNRTSGRVLDKFSTSQASMPTMSLSGKLWAITVGNRTVVRDVDSHRSVMSIAAPASITIDSSDSRLYCTDAVGKTIVRSVPKGEEVAEYLTGGAFSRCNATGDILITGSSVKILRERNRAARREWPSGSVYRDYLGRITVSDFAGNLSFFSDPALSPLGRRRETYPVALSSSGRLTFSYLTGAIAQASNGRKLLQAPPGTTADSAGAKDILIIQSANQKEVECWKFGATKPEWEKKFPNVDRVMAPEISWDGRLVLFGLPHSVEVADAASGRLLKTIECGGDTAPSYAFIGNTSDFFVSGVGYVDVYDGQNLAKRFGIPLATGYWGGSCAVSPDGRRAAVATGTEAFVYDIATGKRALAVLTPPDTGTILFTSDGKKVVLGCQTKPIIILESKDTDRAIHIQVDPAHPLANPADQLPRKL